MISAGEARGYYSWIEIVRYVIYPNISPRYMAGRVNPCAHLAFRHLEKLEIQTRDFRKRFLRPVSSEFRPLSLSLRNKLSKSKLTHGNLELTCIFHR